jgi:hypothetical protein
MYYARANIEVFEYLNGRMYLQRTEWDPYPCPWRLLPEADLHGDSNFRRSRYIASSLDRLVLPSLLTNEPEIVKEIIFRQSFKLVGTFRNTAKSDPQLRHICPSLRLSVYSPSSWNNSTPTGRIFMKIDMSIFRKSVEKIQVLLKFDKKNVHCTEDLYTRMTVSYWNLLRMRNFSDKLVEKNKRRYFTFNKFYFRKSCNLRDNVEKYCTAGQATDDTILWCTRFACWITKDKTHTQNM